MTKLIGILLMTMSLIMVSCSKDEDEKKEEVGKEQFSVNL